MKQKLREGDLPQATPRAFGPAGEGEKSQASQQHLDAWKCIVPGSRAGKGFEYSPQAYLNPSQAQST